MGGTTMPLLRNALVTTGNVSSSVVAGPIHMAKRRDTRSVFHQRRCRRWARFEGIVVQPPGHGPDCVFYMKQEKGAA